jgi:xanthine/CO dehydrogenase XdhC/CoxF family maturation factor
LTEFDIIAREVSGYRTRFEAIQKRLAEAEQGNERRREDRRPGGSQHPHEGGARLSRVEIVFEVASERYPLDERAATLMAENLRVKAAHEPGAEGTVGARAVADAIELRLIEDTADPITLGGDGAEAVFYALSGPTGGGDQPRALYDAVKRLHDEWIR